MPESPVKPLDLSIERTQQTYIRLGLKFLLGLVLLVAVCWVGHFYYMRWQERHALRVAAAYMSGGDYRLAGLSARRALQVSPNNPDAIRLMAKIAEHVNDPSALDWRRKIVELKPDAAEDRVALALCALQFKNIEMAQAALEAVPSGARETGEYQAAAARLAEAQGANKEAIAHWQRALELAPDNSLYELQLARVSLSDPAQHDAGRAMLAKLRSNETQRAVATRLIIVDRASRNEAPASIKDLTRELQSYPEAIFGDRIMYLDVLRQLKDAEFISYLTSTEEAAAANPDDLAALFSWMNRNSLSTLAIDFSRTLSAEQLAKWPVPVALAESYSNVTNWKALEQITREGNWPNLEFLRHAFLSRAYREQGKSGEAAREWEAAKKVADPPQMLGLARTVSEWRWDWETEDLLWQMARRKEVQGEALHTLYERYMNRNDTPGLYRVLTRMAEIDPNNSAIQNNLAQTALLLNIDLPAATKAAASLYEKDKMNVAYATTYAFALYKTEKVPQALQLLSGIKEEEQRDPSISLYYGVILVAAGEKERARPFLERAAAGSKALLAEERILLQTAQNRSRD